MSLVLVVRFTLVIFHKYMKGTAALVPFSLSCMCICICWTLKMFLSDLEGK